MAPLTFLGGGFYFPGGLCRRRLSGDYMTRSAFIILIMALLLTAVPVFGSPDQPPQMRLVIVKKQRLLDILRSLKLDDGALRDVKRNSDGTKLFVTYHGTGTNGDQVAVISPTDLRVISSAGITPNLADDETVASFDRDYSVIIGGTEISYSNLSAEIGFSPGASFYYVFRKGGISNHGISTNCGTTIYRTGKPEQPLIKLDTKFWPIGMFALNNLVDVDGYLYPQAGRVHDAFGCAWTLLRFKLSTTGGLEKYAEFPVKGTIVDVDQRDQLFLGRTHSDLFPRWFLYNMATGRRESMGWVRGYAFFLDPSLAKILSGK